MNDVTTPETPPTPEGALMHPLPAERADAPRAVLSPVMLPDQISLADVVRTVLRGWWIIALTLAASLVLAIAILKSQNVEYTATFVATATAETTAPGSSAVSGLVGTLLGTGTSANEKASFLTQFRYLLASEVVARRLVEKTDILRQVFASEWDAESGTWVRPDSVKSRLMGWINRRFGLPSYMPPSPQRLAEYLSARLVIENVESTPLLAVSFSHANPDLALRLLAMLYEESERLLKEDNLRRAEQDIAFLEQQLKSATLVDHRTAFEQLLTQGLARLMLLNTDAPFAAQLVQAPFVDPRPTSPKPFLVIGIAFVGGIILGIAVSLFVDAMRGR